MNMLLISGSPSTGKSTLIYHICTWLMAKGYVKTDIPYNSHLYVHPTTFPPVMLNDFACILEKNNVKVLIHTATDDIFNIDALFKNVKIYSPRVVVTSCRDYGDWPRVYLCNKFGFTNNYSISGNSSITVEEFPVSKITRKNNWLDVYTWYFTNTTKQIEKLMSLTPYFL